MNQLPNSPAGHAGPAGGDLLKQAEVLIAAGKMEEALAHFDSGLRMAPDDVELHRGKGLLLGQQLGRHTDALQCFDEVLRHSPNDQAAWRGRAAALGALGDFAAAVNCFERVLRADPNDVESWYWNGLANLELARLDAALHCFERALAIDREDARAWFGMATALARLPNQTAAARDAYREAAGRGHPQAEEGADWCTRQLGPDDHSEPAETTPQPPPVSARRDAAQPSAPTSASPRSVRQAPASSTRGRCVRVFPDTEDNLWSIAKTWAQQHGYSGTRRRESEMLFRKHIGGADRLVRLTRENGQVQLEAWMANSILVRVLSLFVLPEEMNIEPGGIVAIAARSSMRKEIGDLGARLGQPHSVLFPKR